MDRREGKRPSGSHGALHPRCWESCGLRGCIYRALPSLWRRLSRAWQVITAESGLDGVRQILCVFICCSWLLAVVAAEERKWKMVTALLVVVNCKFYFLIYFIVNKIFQPALTWSEARRYQL